MRTTGQSLESVTTREIFFSTGMPETTWPKTVYSPSSALMLPSTK